MCWYFFFIPEIIEYSTLVVEAAFDTPSHKRQHHIITEHFDIVTEPTAKKDQITTMTVNHHAAIETIETNETAEVEIIPAVTIKRVQIEPDYTGCAATIRPSTEVVSYQRFGRVDKKTITYPYKCHLCGFSCRFKESLLSHFKEVHPY